MQCRCALQLLSSSAQAASVTTLFTSDTPKIYTYIYIESRFGRPPPLPPSMVPPFGVVWCGWGLLPPSLWCGVVRVWALVVPPFPPCGVVWVGWFPPACLDLLGVFGKPMLMTILMKMMTIIMIVIMPIILVFLWLVVGYLLPTCELTIMALLTVGPRSL